jgi:exonuclease SbcD
MRICHLSDTHLGAGALHSKRGESGLTQRQEDVIRTFVEAVDRIVELKPDVCIHSGDIFDAVRPLNRIIAVAGEQLHRLAEKHSIPTVIITGNHDAPKQPHLGAALDIFRHIRNLYIASESRLEVFDIDPGLRVCALPHCLTAGIQKQELARCVPDSTRACNILVMHGVAAGMPEFSMADLGEQELPLDVMGQFDYTALGHFHNYCQVAPRAYYAGSTERLSQAERGVTKGFIEVTAEPFAVAFHEVKAREMVDLPVISAAGKRGDELAALIREKVEKADSRDKIVRLKVQDVSEETLKTLPAGVINDLKQTSYSLNITFEKEKAEAAEYEFGRAGIGRLDSGFVEFLETVDLKGFDKERLIREALRYFSTES